MAISARMARAKNTESQHSNPTQSHEEYHKYVNSSIINKVRYVRRKSVSVWSQETRNPTCPKASLVLLVHFPYLWVFDREHAIAVAVLVQERLPLGLVKLLSIADQIRMLGLLNHIQLKRTKDHPAVLC